MTHTGNKYDNRLILNVHKHIQFNTNNLRGKCKKCNQLKNNNLCFNNKEMPVKTARQGCSPSYKKK